MSTIEVKPESTPGRYWVAIHCQIMGFSVVGPRLAKGLTTWPKDPDLLSASLHNLTKPEAEKLATRWRAFLAAQKK